MGNSTTALPTGLLPEPTEAQSLINETPVAHGDVSSLVAVLKENLTQLDQGLEARFRAGGDIKLLVTSRAWAVEKLLLTAWHALMPPGHTMALVAVGGFGRGYLHPHSDVDLLILFAEETLSPACQESIEQFVTALWDAGFYLGHSVRNLTQCQEEVRADVATATSLMEARLLEGPRALFDQLQADMAPNEVWPADAFFHAKFKEQMARHEQFGGTAYNLEPNIKEGPGGLRDIQMVGWVAKRRFGSVNLHGLVENGFLSEAEFRELIEGQRYLWRVRFALHLLAGRSEDRLLFDYQREIASWFGYEGDPASNEAVERFMQGYFREVTRLERLNERLLQHFDEELLNRPDQQPTPLGNGFQRLNDYLEVADDELFRRRPLALMELFLTLAGDGSLAGVRASTIRLLVDHLYLIDEDYRRDPEVLACFTQILRQTEGVYTVLQRMNRYGVLARLIPEFASIVGRMQFDLFHVYTVDQHILFVVRNLRRIAYGKYRDIFPHAPKVFQAVEKPELLYLAALFHDIAKGRNGDHSDLGAVDALTYCQALPLEAGDAELVAWLVQNHLLMSQTAQKKDISDPDTINDFAQLVGSRLHLDYLYLLTVADISATSPRLWNGWKSGLLWELRQVTHRALERGREEPLDQREARMKTREAALQSLQEQGFTESAVAQVWSVLPDSVFLRFSADQLAWASSVLLQSEDRIPLAAIRRRDERDVSEVLLVADDFTGLFASTTAIFDEMGLDVLSARIVTGKDGRSFDLFQLMGRDGQPLGERDAQDVQERLETAMREARLRAPLDRPLPRRLRPFMSQPELRFSSARDGAVTVMELICTDEPGLLSKVAAALVASEVWLHDAMIATLGDRVEDTFFVTNKHNKPLDSAAQQALADAIKDILGP